MTIPNEEAVLTAHMQATVDELVPPKIQKLIQHLHNTVVLTDMYRFLGMETPNWLKEEMTRGERAVQIQLEIEKRQGGAFHNMERKEDEARKGALKLNGFDESGAQEQRGFTGGGKRNRHPPSPAHIAAVVRRAGAGSPEKG